MEETWELAVVSVAASDTMKYWYANCSAQYLVDVISAFHADRVDLSALLDECVHYEFGYSGIPKVLDKTDQGLFETSILALDVYQLVFISIQFNLLGRVAEGMADRKYIPSNENKGFQIRALFALASRMNHEIASFKLLLFNDLTVQAVGRCRSFLQCYDAFLLACIDPGFAEKFVKSIQPKDTKHTFFEYLSKSKPDKKIRQFIIDSGGDAKMLDGLEKLSEDFVNELGGMVHPSFYSTLDALFTQMDKLAESEDAKLRSIAVGAVQRFTMLCGGKILVLLADFYLPIQEEFPAKANESDLQKELVSLSMSLTPSVCAMPVICAQASMSETK